MEHSEQKQCCVKETQGTAFVGVLFKICVLCQSLLYQSSGLIELKELAVFFLHSTLLFVSIWKVSKHVV